MPDRGVSIGDPVNTAAHVATPEWQSFEQRMRHRRVERCIHRALEAIDAGRPDEASEAIEEARRLDPLHEQLQTLSDRLTAASGLESPRSVSRDAAIIAPAPSLLFDGPAESAGARPPSFDELPVLAAPLPPPLTQPAPRHGASAWRVAAVACLAIATSAFAGWFAWNEWPSAARSDTAADVRLPLEIPRALRFVPPPPAAAPEPDHASAADTSVAESTVPTTGAADPIDRSAEALASRSPAPAPAPADVVRETTSLPEPTARAAAGTLSPPGRDAAPLPRVETAPASPRAAAPPPSTDNESRALPPRVTPAPRVEEVPQPAPPLAAVVTPPAPPPPAPVAAEDTRALRDEAVRTNAPVVDERVAIRSILSRYESAYSRLDAEGASAIWPGVDRRALARAFESLDSQRVALGSCDVGITGPTARANCSGSATWTPKVGGGTRTEPRTWTFELRRSDSGWQIVKVAAR